MEESSRHAKISVFKIFEDCFTKRSGGTLDEDPEFESAMSNFMLCRIYRMHDFLMQEAVTLDRYQGTLSKSDFYHLAYSMTPRRSRAPYADFIKRRRPPQDGGRDATGDGFAVI